MTDLSGHFLGRYQLLMQLGEGGMATVYKAHDTRLERDVAVKIIRSGAFPSETLADVLKRFEREAKSLARLSHPNIVKVHDFGEHEGSPYLVMEYLPGGTLKKVLGKPIPWQDALRILLPIARGVAYAHQHGILHRDIKPANILITESGDPMLSDFGIAKLFEGEQTTVLTNSGMAIGTPEYMAPEQWTGMASPRSDLYSLGIVLYEMITGRKPYVADTPAAILLKQAMEPLPAPRQFVPGLPEAVEFLLIKTLARDLADRYADMNTLIAVMEDLLMAAPTSQPLPPQAAISAIRAEVAAQPIPPIPTRTEMPPARKTILPDLVQQESAPVLYPGTEPRSVPTNRVPGIGIFAIVGVIALFGAAAILIVVLGLVFSRYARSAPSSTVPSSANTGLATAPPAGLKLLPTSTLINAPFPVTDTPASAIASPLPPTPAPSPTATTASMSANGQWIAFNSRMAGNADIYIVDTSGNNLTQLTNSPAHELYPSWSPDGAELVYQTNAGGDMELSIVNIKTKAIRSLTKNECDDWGPVWSPDGDWIAFYSNCDGEKGAREIYKIRADGSGRKQLTITSGQNNWFPAWSPDGEKITFTSNRSGKYRIYTMNADGSNQQELASGCVSAFSPDGSQILYGVYCDDTDALWLMGANGSNPHTVTSGRECKNAMWSPDGRKIVFQESQSGAQGPFAVFIMDLASPDESNWFKLLDYTQNAGSPAWQP